MTLVKKDAGTPPGRRPNGMPVTVDPKPWMAIPGVTLLVIGILLGAFGHDLDPAGTGELAVLQWFHERRTGFLTFVTEALELLGGPKVVPWLLLGMLVLLLALRRVIMALTAVLLPGIGWLPGHFAKGWFPRERPPETLEPVVVYHDVASFPSGHTGFTTSITIFLLFALTMWGLRRWWMVVLGILAIVAMAVSRLYAAAHFPLDVIGGAVLAGGTSIALWPLASWLWGKGQVRGDWLTEPPYRRALQTRATTPQHGTGE